MCGMKVREVEKRHAWIEMGRRVSYINDVS